MKAPKYIRIKNRKKIAEEFAWEDSLDYQFLVNEILQVSDHLVVLKKFLWDRENLSSFECVPDKFFSKFIVANLVFWFL